MTKSKKIFALALALPFLVLASQTLNNVWNQSSGRVFEFSISGVDPRDLLSGHFLSYRVDYGVPACITGKSDEAFVCLEPLNFFSAQPSQVACKQFIRGSCTEGGSFVAGIERYYIPAENAAELEKQIREKNVKIRVSVSKSGSALVKALLVDDKVW